jgi:hypothetical protein
MSREASTALADWQIASYLYTMKGSKPALGFIFVTILLHTANWTEDCRV